MKKLYILTGASRGMGLAMARQILAAGDTLLGIARTGNDSLKALAVQSGASLEQWQCDLAEAAVPAASLRAWLADVGPSAFSQANLINNAGVIARISPLSAADSLDLSNTLRVGLEAPMLLTAAFLGATEHWSIDRRVLNISSGLGRTALASQAGYCAAKAGMDHFTRCLSLDEARKSNGAKVCSLAPGVIATDMQVQLRSSNPTDFPDIGNFISMHEKGMLDTPQDAGAKVLAYLQRADFGANPVADVRQ
jgi:benzil reductase ((S)-benzoin forming)